MARDSRKLVQESGESFGSWRTYAVHQQSAAVTVTGTLKYVDSFGSCSQFIMATKA